MVQPNNLIDSSEDTTPININITGATTADVMRSGALANPQIAESIRMILALKDIDTKLQEAYELWKAGDIDGMMAAILSSNFYKNNNVTARERQQAKINQPGVYTDGLDKYTLATRKNLVTRGIKMDNKLFQGLATTAYDTGMSEDQLIELIVTSGLTTGFGGNIVGQTSALKSYAESFGVNRYLNDNYWNQKSKDLAIGRITEEDIQEEIRNLSASAFPAYAEQIRAGITVGSIASAFKNAMASTLERDPDSITYEDPRLLSALQYIGPDGKPAIKPLWQFERELRMSPEWELTNNARTTVDNLTYKAFSDMGII